MSHENVDFPSMALHRRIALVLRKEPGLVRDFAERLRSKLAVARPDAVVSDEEWEWYIIRHGYFLLDPFGPHRRGSRTLKGLLIHLLTCQYLE